jgi:DNA gyrase subunit A
MQERIADLVREKKLEGIKELRDESTKDVRVVIGLKNTAEPQKVLNYIYKHTELENVFHLNMVVLVDGIPQTLSLKGVLEEFIKHRRDVVKRRTEFDLRKAEEREHILLGLKKALDHIDEIIKTIKASKDVATAHAALMQKFKFSELQATAILEMRLQKLAGLERKKIEDELKEVQDFIAKCKDILSSAKKIMAVVKGEVKEVTEKFGDDRKSRLVKGGVKVLSDEDLIADEENVLVLTADGYVKRTNPSEYKKQKRGGVGVIDLNTKEEDFVTMFLTTSTHSDVLFFSNKGKAYQIKMYDVPEAKRATKGKALVNFLSLGSEEAVTSVLAMPKAIKGSGISLLMVTKQGVAKKVAAKSFEDVRRSGLIAMTLQKDDELIRAEFVQKGDTVSLVSAKGQAIRFKENDVREMGRTAGGVRAMKLGKGDVIVGVDVVPADRKDAELMVLSENGYGKRSEIGEYKVQKRGGSGIKTASVTAKTGKIMASHILHPDEEELVVISKKGQVIRSELKEIPTLSRATQGVRIMRLRDGDSIASFICL